MKRCVHNVLNFYCIIQSIYPTIVAILVRLENARRQQHQHQQGSSKTTALTSLRALPGSSLERANLGLCEPCRAVIRRRDVDRCAGSILTIHSGMQIALSAGANSCYSAAGDAESLESESERIGWAM